MVLSLVKVESECRRSKEMRKATPAMSPRRDMVGLRGVRDPSHARKQYAREPGDPTTAKHIGLTIPQSLLYRVDEVIKWPVAFR